MEIYTIGLATESPLDDDFIDLIEQAAQCRNLSTYKVLPHNLEETLHRIRNKELRFLSFYDRASDASDEFLELYSAFSENPAMNFVDLEKQETAADKSIMHKRFVKHNIAVPQTIIVPELASEPILKLTEDDLDIIDRPFVIKPCVNTGSGSGVYLNGFSLADVEDKRYEFPEDKYLLQTKIQSKEYNQKLCWFRVFYVCGKTINTWWDTNTHRYEPLSPEDAEYLEKNRFTDVILKIHDVCGLEFFSTELTITEEDKIYAIDYVNEICDMRLQSKYYDGIPDEIVKNIAEEIVRFIEKSLDKKR